MAENQRKVDLDKIISGLINNLEEIRNSDAEQKYKTQKEKRLGSSVHKALYSDGRKAERHQVSLTTYNRYLTKVRKAVSQMDYKRFDFDKQITRSIKKFPEHKERLDSYLSLNLNDVLDDMKQWKKEIGIPQKGSRNEKLFNEVLGKLNPLPPIFDSLSLKAADKQRFKAHQVDKIESKQTSLTELKLSDIKEAITELLNTSPSDPRLCEKLALGVSLACGRRQIEVCYLSDFKTVRNNNYKLQVDGIAKNKDKGKVIIPTLADSKSIIEAVKKLRSHKTMKEIYSFMDASINKNEMFNNKSRTFTTEANHYLLNKFGKKADKSNWVFKDSRAIYARASYFVYCSEQKQKGCPISAEDIFYTQNLAHTDKDAQKSYKAFDVTGNNADRIDHEELVSAGGRTPQERIKALKEFSKNPIIEDNKSFRNVMEKMIPMIEKNPTQLITRIWIRNDVKGAKTIRLNELFEKLERENLLMV